MAVWLRLGTQALQVEGALLPREDAQELLQMQALWAQTRQQLQALQDQARRDAAQVLEAARAQGLEAGHAQALQEWHLQTVQLHAQQQSLHAREREGLAALVAQAVAQVLLRDEAAAFFAQALRHLDTLAEQSRWLKVRVHPDDLATAQAALGVLGQHWKAGTTLKWETDARLAPGSCICESELGLIDASLQPQLAALRAAALAALGGAPQAAPEVQGDAADDCENEEDGYETEAEEEDEEDYDEEDEEDDEHG